MKAVRVYQIIYAARDGLNPEEVKPPMNEEERRIFDSVAKEVAECKAKGKPVPIYELPIDAFDDEDGIDDIYSDDFDEKVMEGLDEE